MTGELWAMNGALDSCGPLATESIARNYGKGIGNVGGCS